MVCAATRAGWGHQGYLEPSHPLQREVLRAIRAVVATHWNIPDRGIRPLMEAFYYELSDSVPASEACAMV